MSKIIRQILIIANNKGNEGTALLEDIRKYCLGNGIEVTPYSFEGDFPDEAAKRADLVISLGGDGTLLYSAGILPDTGFPPLEGSTVTSRKG